MFAADAIRGMRRSSGGGGGGHIYWRVNVTNTVGNSVNIGEVEFREFSGGVTTTSGGLAIGSSQVNSTYSYAKAFDGRLFSASDTWISGTGKQQWVGYQHAEPVDIVEFMVAAGYDTQLAPTDFTLDYSDDGVNWTAVKSVAGQTRWTNYQKRVFPAV